jgi:sugar O-acyltransferase (sialic acid O-acetyltransferase NeuD family)
MNRLIIVGAGGHGKAIANNAYQNGYTEICFVDDVTDGECMGFPIIGKSVDIEKLDDGKTDFVIGIGNNAVRKKVAEKYNVNWVTVINPTAQIAIHVSIGKGTVIMAGAVVNVCSVIGEHCIINTNSVVEHDNIIGNYVHISPNVALGGTVQVGDNTHIGIGASVSNNIDICSDCMIGAGAVVIRNINESGTYVGVPARKIKYESQGKKDS